MDLLSLHVGVFQLELFWSVLAHLVKVDDLSSENLTEDWKFGKSTIEIMGSQIGVDSELVIVIQGGQ